MLSPKSSTGTNISGAYFVNMKVDSPSSYTWKKESQGVWERLARCRDSATDVPRKCHLRVFNVLCLQVSAVLCPCSMLGLSLLRRCSCFFWYKPWFLPGLAALQALKRKKRLEKQLAQIDGTLSTIEFQREALENSHTNTEVLRNMGFAAKAMKAVHENMWVAQTPCPWGWEESLKLGGDFGRTGSLLDALSGMRSQR